MTSTSIPTPPDGYPHPSWTEDESDPFYVAPAYRADYAEVPATPEIYSQANKGVREGARRWDAVQQRPGELIVRPFVEWAHTTRKQRAFQLVNSRERMARWEAIHLRVCPSCGVRSDTAFWQMVRPPASPTDKAFGVCGPCHPLVEHELLAAQLLPDGRSRGDAARELAASLSREQVPA